MRELVFFLEELSAKVMIEGILPKIAPPGAVVRYIVFEGKHDLEKSLFRKLRNYQNPDAVFIILRDQDSADCHAVKKHLQQTCLEAKKSQSIVRIACHELESWYLADLQAVERAFSKRHLALRQRERKFKNPDTLGSPSKELKSLVSEYQKISGSRMIATFLHLENTRSRSFYHFVNAIKTFFHAAKDITNE